MVKDTSKSKQVCDCGQEICFLCGNEWHEGKCECIKPILTFRVHKQHAEPGNYNSQLAGLPELKMQIRDSEGRRLQFDEVHKMQFAVLLNMQEAVQPKPLQMVEHFRRLSRVIKNR
jgi:hypothetical protein